LALSRRAARRSTAAPTSGRFGCVLYELLAGKLAFGGETVPDSLQAFLPVLLRPRFFLSRGRQQAVRALTFPS